MLPKIVVPDPGADRELPGPGESRLSVLAPNTNGARCAILGLSLMPTLLIVDDHEGLRRFARALLGAEGFDVIGEAADGEAALAAVQALHPEVVLLDIQLPGIDGFEVAERLAGSPDAPCLVLMSSRQASDYGARMAESPACGFLPKHELSGAAVAALVARGSRGV